MESYETQFIYVDGYYAKPDGKSSPWKRIKLSEISNLKKKAENFNVFVTAQKFCSPQRIEDELIWGDLYFDLDASEQYPIEIAKEDARKIIDFFTKGYSVHSEYCRPFFSGGKGFHIFINAKILGVQPHSKLNLIFKSIALYLENFLELKTLDTASIYSKRRMMRLTDSLHHKSKLFKIELHHNELEKTIDQIREMAKSPRGSLWDDEEFGNVLPIEDATYFYKHFVDLYKEQEMIERLKPQTLIRNTGETATCVKDLMTNHIRKSGTRNIATLTLAAYFKDQGFSEKDTIEVLLPWALRIPKEYTSSHDENKIKASTISCIKSTYTNDYHFVCSVMRSLGEMQCEYEHCEIANEEDQKPEKEIVLHLSEASNAQYMRKKIKTKVLVAGKDTSPYIVPKRVELRCTPDINKEGSKCHSCKLAKEGGHYEFELNERSALLLECIQCTTIQQIGVLKRLVESTKCDKAKLSILDTGNVEELEITPEIDKQINLTHDSAGSEDYVTRKAYYIGHNIPLNQEIELTCYTYADPKTQHAVHLFNEYSSAETSLNGFKMDDRKRKELSVFQPKRDETIKEKIHAIHKDLELNIHHIWQRTPLFIAFDLVYHSVLSFYFQGDPLKKGWTELLVLGDSGQAKSKSSQKIAEHYGFGFRISGENARRTGLAYTWHQTANRWSVSFGIIPRNDKRIVFIDEAGGIDDEELSKLTDMRSEGIADASGGPIPAKTNARTRLIWMTNTKDGTPLSETPYPVTAILKIFRRTEDIRRFDLAIAVRSGDVPDNVIHQLTKHREKLEHVYTSYLCRNLILWAWTRKADQIIISEETEKEILETAMYMSKKYSSLIPLVEPSDQRNKMARLSVAAACRLFSTDDGHNVIVTPDHVKFVSEFMQEQYDGYALDYYNYSRLNKREFLEDEFNLIYHEFNTYPDASLIADTLTNTGYFNKHTMEDLIGYDKESTNKLLKFFHVHKLVKQMKSSYKLTAAGVNFLKRYFSMHPIGHVAGITPDTSVVEEKNIPNKEVDTTDIDDLLNE